MTFAAVNLLFPVVLAIHNLDEYSRYDDFALLLPYTAVAIVILRASPGDSFRSLFRDAFLGLILAPVAILSLLWISYGPSRLTASPQKP